MSTYTHIVDSWFPPSKLVEIVDQAHECSMILDKEVSHIMLFGTPNYIEGAVAEEVEEPGVEYVMANRFITNMNIAMRANGNPILIHMKSNGS